MTPGHRKDIDGLRAIAVMAVVLHHFGFHGLPAGFAGVDIFFVISGFLIGGIILREQAEGRFSFRTFYARRARRILPALFVMMAVTLPFGWVLMHPDQLRHHGGAIVATILFLSNVWYLRRIDYFNPDAALEPLVHTWSLAVEEQFYIGLPVLILLLWPLGRRVLVATLVIVAAGSFAVMLAQAPNDPQTAFYMIHTRAWELLAGVLVAMFAAPLASLPGRVQAAGGLLGLFLIGFGLLWLPQGAVWPGAWTAVAVAGTALVLAFGPNAPPVRRVLELPPMVWVGAISYSLYLWHQPVLGFARLAELSMQDRAVQITALVLCFGLAAISWRFVEQPFRQARVPRAGWLLGGVAVGLTAFAVTGHVSNGYMQRLPEPAQVAMAFQKSHTPSYRACPLKPREALSVDPAAACVHGDPTAPRVAVWGDSHAAVLAGALGERLAAAGIGVVEQSVAACPPILGIRIISIAEGKTFEAAEYCDHFNRRVLAHLASSPQVDLVVLNGYWANYASTLLFQPGQGLGTPHAHTAAPLEGDWQISEAARVERLQAGLRDVVQTLRAAGKLVLILDPLPQPGSDLPVALATRLWRAKPVEPLIRYPATAFAAFAAPARQVLDAVPADTGVWRLDASGAFCDAQTCQTVIDGAPLFMDDNHLSLAGVGLVVPKLADAVLAALRP